MGREWRVWVLAAGWAGLVLYGFWGWERYDRTEGAVGPSTAHVVETAGRWKLSVFVHPHCPCARAMLPELDKIARENPTLSTRILFVRPPDSAAGWERGESWDCATQVPGAEVVCDADGTVARQFGAETSGQAVLTDPTGVVVFRGGLTPARGRAGPSVGQDAVTAWLGGGGGATVAAVFGCPLFTPAE